MKLIFIPTKGMSGQRIDRRHPLSRKSPRCDFRVYQLRGLPATRELNVVENTELPGGDLNVYEMAAKPPSYRSRIKLEVMGTAKPTFAPLI